MVVPLCCTTYYLTFVPQSSFVRLERVSRPSTVFGRFSSPYPSPLLQQHRLVPYATSQIRANRNSRFGSIRLEPPDG